MEKQKKILDASVIVKWFSKEVDSNKALKLKKEHLEGGTELIISELTLLEVMNALRYKEKDENKLKVASEMLYEIGFKIEKLTKSLLDKSIENAFRHDITIYDSIYISLIQTYDCPLITSDSALYKIHGVIPLEKV